MIATGGLLRINARRQDSLRSKPRPKPKKKSRKKRRQEVVVVKGKIQFCSVSGLVLVLGLMVLVLGGVMAAVGYCPRDALRLTPRPPEGATTGSEAQLDYFNTTHSNFTLSLIQLFLQRFLDSDRLKVLGPLVMGVGIFLFLCANAVLHENRDRKTKVIKLRDIYSTVIDLHQNRDQNRDRDQDRDQDLQNRQNHSLESGLKPGDENQENGGIGSKENDEEQDEGFLTRWRLRKGSSVRERKEETRERRDQQLKDEERGNNEGTNGQNGRQKSILTKWRLRKGGSVKERREVYEGRREGVFSVFHEHRFSLPSGLSFHRTVSDKRRRKTENEQKITTNEEEQEQEEVESKEQDTGNTSFSLIGSQRPLLMMSRSSLSPTHLTHSANQRRSSLFNPAHYVSLANRRSSWI